MWMVLSLFIFSASGATPDADDSILQSAEAPVAVRLFADLGAVAQLSHRLQIGTDGSDVRIPRELGQDVLYPFVRFQVDLDIGPARRHSLSFLYQPIDLRSEVAPERRLVVGDVAFSAGEVVRFRYGFPFYRTTWMVDAAPSRDTEWAFGVGLQVRNANIVYSAGDGSKGVSARNIGPVPLLAFRSRWTVTKKMWTGAELQGFYAPVSGLNGSTNEVVGAIADGSWKWGLDGPRGSDLYVALRYIGGGATGTSNNPDPFSGDGYTKN